MTSSQRIFRLRITGGTLVAMLIFGSCSTSPGTDTDTDSIATAGQTLTTASSAPSPTSSAAAPPEGSDAGTTPPPVQLTTTTSDTQSGSATPTTIAPPAADTPFADPQRQQLAALLQEAVPTLPNANASVMATVRLADGRVWSAAAGGSDAADQPVRMASVGKTFTAAATFRLVEDGELSLDDPIGKHLSEATAALLTSDGYDVSKITIRHLLQHTSGIFDYAFGEDSPLLDRALNDQTHRWTRREQLELAVFVGSPLSEPGVTFHYGDTGYVLLGEIIEQLTGQPFPTAMRALIGYDRLGLDATWMEYGEPSPTERPIANSYFDQTDLTPLDFSIDGFGGGGLAARTADIARFFEALLAGRVFNQPSTLTLMTDVPSTNTDVADFDVLLGDGASGLYRLELGNLGACWSHRGFLGTIAISCPEAGATVALTTNTALTDPLPIATQLLQAALA